MKKSTLLHSDVISTGDFSVEPAVPRRAVFGNKLIGLRAIDWSILYSKMIHTIIKCF